MGKGRPGGNPDIVEIGKETRYKKGDKRAAKNGKKGAEVNSALKTVKEIATDKLNEENQKILNGIVMRLLKMSADGNLPAIQYLFKVIGQDPGDLINIQSTSVSEETRQKLDALLLSTKGEIK